MQSKLDKGAAVPRGQMKGGGGGGVTVEEVVGVVEVVALAAEVAGVVAVGVWGRV